MNYKQIRKQWMKAETYVCKKLWQYGYRARKCRPNSSFDILVDDEKRLEVKSSSKRDNKWFFQKIYPNNFDFLALVFYGEDDKPEAIIFASKEVMLKVENGGEINGYNLQLSLDKLQDFKGSISPLKVLGKPKKCLSNN